MLLSFIFQLAAQGRGVALKAPVALPDVRRVFRQVPVSEGEVVDTVIYIPKSYSEVVLALLGAPGSVLMYETPAMMQHLVDAKRAMVVVSRQTSTGKTLNGVQTMLAAQLAAGHARLRSINRVMVYSGSVLEARQMAEAGQLTNTPVTFVAPAFCHRFDAIKQRYERRLIRACTPHATIFDKMLCILPLTILSWLYGRRVRKNGIGGMSAAVRAKLEGQVANYRMTYPSERIAFKDPAVRAALATVLAQTIAYPRAFREHVATIHRHTPAQWKGVRLAPGSRIVCMSKDRIATRAMADALARAISNNIDVEVIRNGRHFDPVRTGWPT